MERVALHGPVRLILDNECGIPTLVPAKVHRRISPVLSLEWQNSALSLGTPLQWFDKVGRWRWSKPDKDTLVEALRFLKKQAE